jgi:hypothetical protein
MYRTGPSRVRFCASGNQSVFSVEMVIHFTGHKNIDNPGVWLCPKLLVCLNCGFSRFTVSHTELVLLAAGTPTSERLQGETGVDDVALPPAVAL